MWFGNLRFGPHTLNLCKERLKIISSYFRVIFLCAKMFDISGCQNWYLEVRLDSWRSSTIPKIFRGSIIRSDHNLRPEFQSATTPIAKDLSLISTSHLPLKRDFQNFFPLIAISACSPNRLSLPWRRLWNFWISEISSLSVTWREKKIETARVKESRSGWGTFNFLFIF